MQLAFIFYWILKFVYETKMLVVTSQATEVDSDKVHHHYLHLPLHLLLHAVPPPKVTSIIDDLTLQAPSFAHTHRGALTSNKVPGLRNSQG